MQKIAFLYLLLFFLAPAFGNSTLNLKVSGMHCGGCESRFKSAASGIKGIIEVNSVSASTGTAVVTYDEKTISPENAVQELADRSGFTVSVSDGKSVAPAAGKSGPACCMKGQGSPACSKAAKAKCAKKCKKTSQD